MTVRLPLLAAAALLATGLAACSRSEPEAPPVDNAAIEGDAVPDAALGSGASPDAGTPTAVAPAARDMPPPPEPSATPDANIADTATVDEPAAPAPDQQVMDDASVTGMTARASRDAPPADDRGDATGNDAGLD